MKSPVKHHWEDENGPLESLPPHVEVILILVCTAGGIGSLYLLARLVMALAHPIAALWRWMFG